MSQEYTIYHVAPGDNAKTSYNQTMKPHNKSRKSKTLSGLGFVDMIPSPRLGFLRRFFLANHLASNDNLTSNNQETEHIQTQANVNTKVALINNNIHNFNKGQTAWFVCLLQHTARKWSRSIFTTREPA